MTHSRISSQSPSRRRNLIAILISAGIVGILYFNFDPYPAGTDPQESLSNGRTLAATTIPISLSPAGQGMATVPDNVVAAGNLGGIQSTNVIDGDVALAMNLDVLEKGYERLSKIPGYSAVFSKRERVNGAMQDSQTIDLKIRHKPFSVYMKWLVGDKGRELLYVAGQNDGNMLVKIGGVKGRLLPTVKLNPTGSLALQESRYPISRIGLLNLAKTIIEFRRRDIEEQTGTSCRMIDNQVANNRPCYCFVIEYPNRSVSNVYRKSVAFVDKELMLPIHITNYGWPDQSEKIASDQLDEATLIEQYVYNNIQLNRQLADSDFDRKNKKYRFRR